MANLTLARASGYILLDAFRPITNNSENPALLSPTSQRDWPSFPWPNLVADQTAKELPTRLSFLTIRPAESQNVAAQQRDIVKTLSAKVEVWVATLPKEFLNTRDKDE